VDENPLCIRTIRENLVRCGFSCDHPVLQCRLPDDLTTVSQRVRWKAHIVFMDPPYGWEGQGRLLFALHRCSLLEERARIVLEHFHKDVFPRFPEEFALGRQRRYGDTMLTFCQYLGGETTHGQQ